MSSTTQSVACFGKKRTATAVAIAKQGKGLSTFKLKDAIEGG
jgi:ribosomal protein S9